MYTLILKGLYVAWRPQSTLPDACWLRHIVLRQCASTRAAAMFVSHGPTWRHLTLSSGTIHIPAALSLPPYQCRIVFSIVKMAKAIV